MSHPITIQIPDAVFDSLQQRAKQLGKTPEVVAAECIELSVVPPEEDPLLKWAGAIDSGPGDAAERHDYYIGEALAKEMRGETDE
ncbi:MAG: hypothetical protein HY289_04270 [Planctomycetes bacterium]|nr:hypothetical protein [Planctomycetota bacterium]